MVDQQTCPNCGAAIHKASGSTTWYECKTMEWYVRSERAERISDDCYERQIAAQAAEIERLKQAVLDEREACSHIAWTHVCTDECKSDIDGSSCGIRIAEVIAMRGRVK